MVVFRLAVRAIIEKNQWNIFKIFNLALSATISTKHISTIKYVRVPNKVAQYLTL